ncbi:uncharacterized membrane protein YsdA (DUF1294 family)/cold shock CspA family protein [Variovorax boronicumulans]|uniref:Uncharacterized membrane protein YsdA (DUF1294 family)/cold shock CspA family protein n=1 Tax=Variovorax boronicumulans TaxID=436515 RepID=A0AAW8CUK7_9BURK|nr:cold shock and DUF1294 domain-containing protein [Variovorax boronicumulans]MDP9891417.1 uncharacterized membrane protein YsdA (DUF1294 family)/cold shock CspA family protein [Variovorax boronicumulans]MDQ0051485.1 uncharacterized membrane protein YsdA (DUF1294 family)/cold shock CspA family protein [Variovorax boronicumulans]
MKRQGRLVRWEADRGFGFIRSPEVSADVFVHLRDFSDRQAKPQVGMELSFEEIHVGGKGPRAVAVQAVSARASRPVPKHTPINSHRRPVSRRSNPRRSSTSEPPASWGLLFLLAYGALLSAAVWSGRLPLLVLGVVPGLSLLAFLAYAFDKSAAQTGRWRTKESTLHLLALAGGWPGAWAAQRLLRHKSSKQSFLLVYRATVVLHCAAVLAWVFWLRGIPVLD